MIIKNGAYISGHKYFWNVKAYENVKAVYTPYSKMAANKLFFCLHVT